MAQEVLAPIFVVSELLIYPVNSPYLYDRTWVNELLALLVLIVTVVPVYIVPSIDGVEALATAHKAVQSVVTPPVEGAYPDVPPLVNVAYT